MSSIWEVSINTYKPIFRTSKFILEDEKNWFGEKLEAIKFKVFTCFVI